MGIIGTDNQQNTVTATPHVGGIGSFQNGRRIQNDVIIFLPLRFDEFIKLFGSQKTGRIGGYRTAEDHVQGQVQQIFFLDFIHGFFPDEIIGKADGR